MALKKRLVYTKGTLPLRVEPSQSFSALPLQLQQAQLNPNALCITLVTHVPLCIKKKVQLQAFFTKSSVIILASFSHYKMCIKKSRSRPIIRGV